MNENGGRCKHLFDFCPGCQRNFRRDERYLSCPDCGAGRQCKNYRVKGYDFCHLHGGKPNLKARYEPKRGRAIMTGEHSSSPVAKLAAKYIKMSESGPLVNNSKVLSILDDRIIELLNRIEENYSENRVKKIIKAWQDLKSGFPGMEKWVADKPTANKAFHTLEIETEKAYHDYESWNQVGDFMKMRSTVSKEQVSILKDLKAMITAEDAYELSAQLLAAVVTVLKDEPNGAKLTKSIHGEFARILGEPSLEPLGGREQEIIDIDTSRMDRAEFLYPGDPERQGTEGEDPVS